MSKNNFNFNFFYRYVLRNWIAEEAIRAAEDNQDYSLVLFAFYFQFF